MFDSWEECHKTFLLSSGCILFLGEADIWFPWIRNEMLLLLSLIKALIANVKYNCSNILVLSKLPLKPFSNLWQSVFATLNQKYAISYVLICIIIILKGMYFYCKPSKAQKQQKTVAKIKKTSQCLINKMIFLSFLAWT